VPLTINRLINGFACKRAHIGNNSVISGAAYSSRVANPGGIFFAIKGTRHDGNQYIDQAIGQGAALIVTDDADSYHAVAAQGHNVLLVGNAERAMARLADSLYDNVAQKLQLVGVTGTNGKTSTVIMAYHLLNHLGDTAMSGTVYNVVGTDKEPATMTTPLSLDLLRLFSRMYAAGNRRVVLEVSSHALARFRAPFPFQVAALTNITQDHLDFHHTMAAYERAKLSLFDYVVPGGTIIVPEAFADHPMVRSHSGAKRVVTFGGQGDYSIVPGSPQGTLRIQDPQGETVIACPFFSHFMRANLLVAFIIARSLGREAAGLLQAAANVSIPGRMERVPGAPWDIYIDYAHTPDAIHQALTALKERYAGKRVLVVFGAGGDRDTGKRKLMGRSACLADIVILTEDNSRSEEPADIMADIRQGITGKQEGTSLFLVPERAAAIGKAFALAAPGDAVAVLGKGHEAHMEKHGRKVAYNDRRCVEKWLRQKGFAV